MANTTQLLDFLESQEVKISGIDEAIRTKLAAAKHGKTISSQNELLHLINPEKERLKSVQNRINDIYRDLRQLNYVEFSIKDPTTQANVAESENPIAEFNATIQQIESACTVLEERIHPQQQIQREEYEKRQRKAAILEPFKSGIPSLIVLIIILLGMAYVALMLVF